jgi:hypothetical protein
MWPEEELEDLLCDVTYSILTIILRVYFSLYRPWRPSGFREVEAPKFSDIRLTDGGKFVSSTHFLPSGRFLVLISVRG